MPEFTKVPVTSVKPGDIVLYAHGVSDAVRGVSTDVDDVGCPGCNTPAGATTIELWFENWLFPVTFNVYEAQGVIPTVEVYL